MHSSPLRSPWDSAPCQATQMISAAGITRPQLPPQMNGEYYVSEGEEDFDANCARVAEKHGAEIETMTLSLVGGKIQVVERKTHRPHRVVTVSASGFTSSAGSSSGVGKAIRKKGKKNKK